MQNNEMVTTCCEMPPFRHSRAGGNPNSKKHNKSKKIFDLKSSINSYNFQQKETLRIWRLRVKPAMTKRVSRKHFAKAKALRLFSRKYFVSRKRYAYFGFPPARK
jgi:hypothetical protein